MELLETQRCIILATDAHYQKYRCDPSFRHLMAECDIKSANTIGYHIKRLSEMGLMSMVTNATGGKTILRPLSGVVEAAKDGASREEDEREIAPA